jgi:hypothetical protein
MAAISIKKAISRNLELKISLLTISEKPNVTHFKVSQGQDYKLQI